MNCCTRITFWLIKKGFDIYDWFTSYKYEPVSKHVSAVKLPWLFVGLELESGEIVDRTNHAQHLVESGIIVTRNTISTPIEPQLIRRYFYLDMKTLKEEEIPAEGITINDS